MILQERDIAALWPELVCFEKRRVREIPFLLEQFRQYKEPCLLDACLGSGATSIGLHLAGQTRTVSNEKDPAFLEVALQEAKKYGISLQTTCYDWQEIGERYENYFDAVLCLGNSLTLISEENLRRKILESFQKSLRVNGKLILDQRNYSDLFLSDYSGKNYVWSGNVVYCGISSFQVTPLSISSEGVVMEYTHIQTKQQFRLQMYPFREGQLEKELQRAGFGNIQTFGDYKTNFNKKSAEFLTYVCSK